MQGCEWITKELCWAKEAKQQKQYLLHKYIYKNPRSKLIYHDRKHIHDYLGMRNVEREWLLRATRNDVFTFLIVMMVFQVYTFVKTYKIEDLNYIVYCIPIRSQLTCYKIVIEMSLVYCSLFFVFFRHLESENFVCLFPKFYLKGHAFPSLSESSKKSFCGESAILTVLYWLIFVIINVPDMGLSILFTHFYLIFLNCNSLLKLFSPIL